MVAATSAIISAGAAVAQGVAGGIQAKQQADAAAAQAEEQARAAKIQANEKRRAAVIEERMLRRKGKQLRGEQAVQVVGSGLELQGSTLAALEDSAFELELEIAERRRAAEIEASELERGVQFSLDQAKRSREMGDLALGAGIGTGVLGGLGSGINLFDPNTSGTMDLFGPELQGPPERGRSRVLRAVE